MRKREKRVGMKYMAGMRLQVVETEIHSSECNPMVTFAQATI
jgi:hypothetical protein